ncbi:Listeria/Bacterioides repeat-containing protein [Paenibacillus sp. UNCCL117]|uniref:DUF4838 domain-containing protein n=1 Tax=unclassified Paenibacillus TaxID=185978 RepID=UPI000884C315|nr:MULTISPECIES: DUF4838 domain-containing protein [unclassified Paenibacillus]SDE25356.1 Listeria/Bacterioides repeat-containing protein [Paenibacillus sp. cl123]SFW62403.1 Listeria/Bacterioides repeat-containing protein [Paenibacillus sp. UNCCL117]
MTRKLFLCWGLIIALLFSSVPQVLAANAPTGFTQGNTMLNDTGPKLVLVENGESRSTIIMSQHATEYEKKAMQELKHYIRQISGAELPVAEDSAEVQGTKIYIGGAAPDLDAAKAAIRAQGNEPDSFRLYVEEGVIQLAGLDDNDKGSLYAAYELLEQIGVRWFMPGDIGTVVPSMPAIAVDYQDTIQHPGFHFRFLQAVAPYVAGAGLPVGVNLTEGTPWVEHVRLNQKTLGNHGLLITSPTNKERPDLFLPDAKGNPTGQYDVTKPEVLNLVVAEAIRRLEADPKLEFLRMGPNDGPVGVLHPNPEWDGDLKGAIHGGTLSLTDRYVKFFNLVLEKLDAAGYHDVKISFYAYDEYYYPPVRHMPDPRLVPIIASIRTDRMKSIENPLSWERQHIKDLIDGWRRVSPDVMIYDYLYNLADPGLPFSLAERIGTEYKYFKDQGIIGIRGEALPAWGYHGPGLYLAAKMMWNPDLDVGALLEDYFTKFYGPAAEPMKRHFKALEDAFAKADYYAGSIHDVQHILTGNVMQAMEQSLTEAEHAAQGASDPVYARRVNMVRVAFSFGDSFLQMKERINSFEFVEAKGIFDQISKIREKAVTHSPVILNTLASYNYTDWFFDKITTQGSQRLSDGNRMVAKLPDEWDVILFPNSSGDKLGLWKPGVGTESWMKLKTYSESWSDQGIGYYKGHAWYRTTVDVGSEFHTGKPIRLWFSGIDETARVWMNGIELSLSANGKGNAMMKPWEFDATPAIKFGESNLIVVDVGNESLDELGTGGITGPAMLWQVNTELDMISPTPPENLKAEQISGNEVRLSWSPATDNVGVVAYMLEVLNPASIGGINGTVRTDSTTYIHTGLEPLERRYRVKAIDAAGNISGIKDVVTIKMTPVDDTYTVTFNSNGGNGVAAITDVTSGSAIQAPTLPVREGYTFAGWYKDEGLETAWNFTTDVVTGDVTLYAKWTAEETANPGPTPTPAPIPIPTPVPATKVVDGQATTTIPAKPATDTTKKAIAPISDKQLEDAIAKTAAEAAKQGTGIETTVKIEVNAGNDATTAGVSLTHAALKAFVVSNVDSLVISTPFGTMTFDKKAAEGMVKQLAGTITMTATKVEASELTSEMRNKVGDRPFVSFDVAGREKEIVHFDGKVEITIPYKHKADENPNAIVAYIVNAAGKLEIVTNSLYDPGTGTLTFQVEEASKFAVAYNKADFTDVAEGVWYYDAVTFAAARGITTGVGHGNFGGTDRVTRAQALVMIMRAFGISPNENIANNFDDAGNAYYTGYLAEAKKQGIASGVGDNKFDPDRQVTRQELLVLVYNTLQNINELPAAGDDRNLEQFKDAGKVADYANQAIQLFVKAGIIAGTNGSILPEDSASRAQFVQILYNIMAK